MNEAQPADLLDLELSHDGDNDVSKPGSNDDGMNFFSMNADDPTQQLLGNSTLSNESEQGRIGSKNSVGISIDPDSGRSPSKATSGSAGNGAVSATSAKCWEVAYYQPYFDLDTKDELYRLRKALLPFVGGQFYDKELDEKPDLYGPFWITTTLAFLMAAMGNFAAYINTSEDTVGEWSGDITRISEAATFLYTVFVMVPLLLYIVFRTYAENMSLVELVSLYGYSLMPFIIACVLCIAPWNLFDWITVLLAMAASITFLIRNLYKPLSADKRGKPGLYVLVIIFGCQFILALALKLYFFKY